MVEYEAIGLTLTVLLVAANGFLIAGGAIDVEQTGGVLSWLPGGVDKGDVNAFNSNVVGSSSIDSTNPITTEQPTTTSGIDVPFIGGTINSVFTVIPLLEALLFGWAIVLNHVLAGYPLLVWVIVLPISTIQLFSLAYFFLRLFGYFRGGGN